MSKELVISSNHQETKVAVLEDDQLVEIYFQRANEYSLAGSIHKGRVTRVLPGMQSAFVDLGLERDTFLYVSDFFEENGDEYDRVSDEKPPRGGSGRGEVREPRGESRPETRAEYRAEAVPGPAAAAQAAVSPIPPAELPQVQTLDAIPGTSERVEEADRNDRRNRRSRRRRSRGRGFPESKYAAGVPAEDTSDAAPAAEEEPVAEVFLLPGESLAKYRDRDATSADFESAGEPESAEGFEAEFPESEDIPVAEALSDLVLERLESGQVADETESSMLAADIGTGEELADDVDEAEDELPAIVRSEDDDEIEAGALTALEEDHLLDQLETLQTADEMDAPEALTTGSDEPSVAFSEEVAISGAEEGRPEQRDEEPATAASVREQGARYQHRQSRRMRRKRGTDNRSPQPEPTPPPALEAEARNVHGADKPALPSISDLLREGQEIIVQIAKEPLGQKGARITSHIALPGRFVVYMPTLEHLGVSRKISTDEERQRLKRILQGQRGNFTGGFIVRTAGEGRSEEEIASDMAYLYNAWLDIRSKAEKRRAPALLHHDLDIVQRILRDQLSDMFKAIWVDNEEVYESIVRFMQRFQPSLTSRVKMYTRPAPIFEFFNITGEVEKALRPKVWLKSGGYIVVNQTEALVAIDVNTGKFVGKSNRLEDTITKINTEAVKEIARQIRLRDLGGIIVIDFIDMDERRNRQKVMQALEEAMKADRAPYKILQFNDFGLVAITRKRVKQSLERALCSPCPTCEGAGYTKSVNTTVGEILQEAGKVRSSVEGNNVVLRVFPEVARHLKSNSNSDLEEIESILGRPVMVMSDPMLHPEKFDLAW